jgi:hypothetical protein
VRICYALPTETAHLFHWIETSVLARAIGQSVLLTGMLSAIHLIGVTLVGGGALVSGLRLMRLVLRDQPAAEVTRTGRRMIGFGAAISITTGLFLFTARATTAASNGTFQVKMILLATALAFYAGRRGGVLASILWFAVIGAGCAFILYE